MLLFSLTYCTKSTGEADKAEISETKLKELQAKVANEVLLMADQTAFRKFVLAECMKQKHGDYYVHLSDVVSHFATQVGYEKSITALNTSVKRIKQLNGGAEPILFYPRAETIAKSQGIREETITADVVETSFSDQAIAVYQNVYNADYSAPGYVQDDNGNLVFDMNVTEEFAWNNDVYVIGDEEGSGEPNASVAVRPREERIEGEAEYGGIIKITGDMNDIEHWTAGKFEFRLIVHNASGILTNDLDLPQTPREDLRYQRVKDYNIFLFSWNTPNIGQWTIERWIEEDGGGNKEISQTYPAPCTGCPTTTVKVNTGDNDENLGSTMVQFLDNKQLQWYNITLSSIKRK